MWFEKIFKGYILENDVSEVFETTGLIYQKNTLLEDKIQKMIQQI